ncbi:MAG: TetR family transcriptional regulator [Sneathiella sp.]|nr:TetR family transcriptional regulator [Sneathiella sp.]
MNKIVVKRAINDRQKEARREAILKGARDLFTEAGFFDVSMAMIAKHSGLAKGTVYLYFKTKEEIFLALSTEELEAWLDDFDSRLTVLAGPIENAEFLDILQRSFEGRTAMQRLLSLLHLVLEKNITYEEAFCFKQNLIRRTDFTGKLIEKALPYLSCGQGISVLTLLQCLVVGWVQMSDHSPVIEKVLEHPQMAPFKFDLQKNLFESLSLLLAGLKATAE